MNVNIPLIRERQKTLARLITGKMSHDLNNIIGAMAGTISVLERQFAEDEKTLKRVGLLKRSVDKVEEFSETLSGFCPSEERQVVLLPLEELVEKFQFQLKESGLMERVSSFDFGRDQAILIKGNEELVFGLLYHAMSLFSAGMSIAFAQAAIDVAYELPSGESLRRGNYLKATFSGGKNGGDNSVLDPLPDKLLQAILSINMAHIEYIDTDSTAELSFYFQAKNHS